MKKLIHILRYNFNPLYRQQYNNKIRFMKIMQINKSIINGLEYKEKIKEIAS